MDRSNPQLLEMRVAPDTQQPLSGQFALVTGGARGIGAAIVRTLVADGADVLFTYNGSADAAAALVDELSGTGRDVAGIHADLGARSAAEALVEQAASRAGRIDILVNNAAVTGVGTLEQIDDAALEAVLAVNACAPFSAIRHAVRHMRRGGRIVNVGSVSSDFMPYAGYAAYVMSKAALQGMTRGLTRELAPRGITINTVQPGRVETSMLHHMLGSRFDVVRDAMPSQRFGNAAEVASLVAYLCSAAAAFITGANLRIDGGVSV